MNQLPDGRWKVDKASLPPGMEDTPEILDYSHDLLALHARAELYQEAKGEGLEGRDADTWVEHWMGSKRWRFKLAMEEAEGKHGTEIQHARLLRRAEDLAKRRAERHDESRMA